MTDATGEALTAQFGLGADVRTIRVCIRLARLWWWCRLVAKTGQRGQRGQHETTCGERDRDPTLHVARGRLPGEHPVDRHDGSRQPPPCAALANRVSHPLLSFLVRDVAALWGRLIAFVAATGSYRQRRLILQLFSTPSVMQVFEW
ncbi:hypothetical protein SDC9_174629 [bioreactor metagenome]|uniref:Uncharacterized protein n=1 Tax=bioreactor metagenome TaxID=1076179 RepID=A0A645GMV2_9ZZZZ